MVVTIPHDFEASLVRGGAAPVNPLLPLIAVPTTTGTGAESTTICVLDVLAQRVKSGISHPRLRPTLAVVDPALTATQPAGVTASAGMDILCHALESYTARPYTGAARKQPEQRVPYCGANPISVFHRRSSASLRACTVPGTLRTSMRRDKGWRCSTSPWRCSSRPGCRSTVWIQARRPPRTHPRRMPASCTRPAIPTRPWPGWWR